MKTGKKYFIIYNGNLTGKNYINDIAGIADSITDAQQLLIDLVNDDMEMYGKMDKTAQSDLFYYAERIKRRKKTWYSYHIKERELYVP